MSSLIAGKELNDELDQMLRSNWPEGEAFHSEMQFSPGIRGLRDCLRGDFDYVTIIAHSRDGLPGVPGLVVETELDGKSVSVPLPSRFFENYLTGKNQNSAWKISSKIRGLNLVSCDGLRVIHSNSGLARLIEQQGWVIRMQPWDSKNSENVEKKRTRLGGLTSLFLAEDFQSSQRLQKGQSVFCLVDTRDLGLFGETFCHHGLLRIENRFFGMSGGIYWMEISAASDSNQSIRAISAFLLDQDEAGKLLWLEHHEDPRFKVSRVK